MHKKPKILIIEDDPDILELIQFNLDRHGFESTTSSDGEKGLELAKQSNFDLVVLDIMLPGMDGLSVLQQIKQNEPTRRLKVILLTAKSQESDIVIGLELGADDYVTKPFSPKELIARVKAVLRRGQGSSEETKKIIEIGPLRIDLDRHEIHVNGTAVALTLAEFKIMKLLASRPGSVFTRDQILEVVAGADTYVIDRNVDVHIRSIRKKLGEFKDLIQTIRGVGYKCKD